MTFTERRSKMQNKHKVGIEQGSQLEGLINGVEYIINYYDELQGIQLSSDEVFNAILDVMQIERLQRHDQDFTNIDSFVREQVFELIRRDRDN